MVCARHLKQVGYEPHVWFFGAEPKPGTDAGDNFHRWRDAGGHTTLILDAAIWEKKRERLARAQIIVDALLGTGLRGAAEGLIAQAIDDVNRVSKNGTAAKPVLILAIDTPSGLPSDGEAASGPVVAVHRTVTFTAPKIGQLESRDTAQAGYEGRGS